MGVQRRDLFYVRMLVWFLFFVGVVEDEINLFLVLDQSDGDVGVQGLVYRLFIFVVGIIGGIF